MKLSRNQKFTAIIGLGLLMLVGIGVVSYRYTSAFISSVEERKESYEIIAVLDGMLSDLKNIESAEQASRLAADIRKAAGTGDDPAGFPSSWRMQMRWGSAWALGVRRCPT